MPMLLLLLEDDVGCWFEKPDTGGPPEIENDHKSNEIIKQPPIKDKCFLVDIANYYEFSHPYTLFSQDGFGF
jgi:hypothetical protein